jgi:hypothetical protein
MLDDATSEIYYAQLVEEESTAITKINGRLVAGPGSLYNDSDWNGSPPGHYLNSGTTLDTT